MRYTKVWASLAILLPLASPHLHGQHPLYWTAAENEAHISFEVRAHWMRRAKQALSDLISPCPFAAFGTAIVNHTASNRLGELICIGANNISETGNPSLHGEIAGINNCSRVLTDKTGPHRLSPSEAQEAFRSLSLYTTAEPCPMCAGAIRWAGFKECIYGTSISTLVDKGWSQFDIPSKEVFERSATVSPETRLLEEVLTNETDPLFSWQYEHDYPCPYGCHRDEDTCSAMH